MKTPKITNRVLTGEAVLAAARLVDTRSIAAWLETFAAAHEAHARAQAGVDAAATRAQAVLQRVGELDVHQDAALEKLALLLALDGKPRANPLAGYTDATPSGLRRTAAGDEAAQLIRLASAVRNDATVSAATRVAADTLETAAQAVLAALEPLPPLEAALREARHIRDHTVDRWDEALANLRLAARVAGMEGAPGLHDALFARSVRRATRKSRPKAAAGTTPADESADGVNSGAGE